MLIRFRSSTKIEKAQAKKDQDRAEKADTLPPPTIEQRISGTKTMGYIGGALFTGFLLTIGYSIYENSKTIPVDGAVVSISSERSGTYNGTSDGSNLTVYWHKFRFTDQDGAEHIAESVGDGRDTSYSVGDIVSIGYYADDYSKVRVRSWFGLWKVQLLLAGLGLTLIAYSIKAVQIIRDEEQTET